MWLLGTEMPVLYFTSLGHSFMGCSEGWLMIPVSWLGTKVH
jgi:hypothetical protein